MKVLPILFLLAGLASCRKITRIIRTKYDVQFTYKDDDFKTYVDSEFSKFDSFTEKYQKERIGCVERYLPVAKLSRQRCLGSDFEIFDRGFDLIEYKMNAILYHMLDLAFNENCMDVEVNHRICLTMLEDVKLLVNHGYNVVGTLSKNAVKYLTATFTKRKFARVLGLLDHVLVGYEKATEELPNKRMVIKGLVNNALVNSQKRTDVGEDDEQEEASGKADEDKHESDEAETDEAVKEDSDQSGKQTDSSEEEDDSNASLLEQEGGHDKYFVASVKNHIKNKYAYLEREYKTFLDQKHIASPYKPTKEDQDKNSLPEAQEAFNEAREAALSKRKQPAAKSLPQRSNSDDPSRYKRNLIDLLDHRAAPANRSIE